MRPRPGRLCKACPLGVADACPCGSGWWRAFYGQAGAEFRSWRLSVRRVRVWSLRVSDCVGAGCRPQKLEPYLRAAGLDPDESYDFGQMNNTLESQIVDNDEDTMKSLDESLYDKDELEHAKSWMVKWGFALSFIFLILWPVLTIPAFAFTEGYWTFWVILSLLWEALGGDRRR